jgi:predicted esterase
MILRFLFVVTVLAAARAAVGQPAPALPWPARVAPAAVAAPEGAAGVVRELEAPLGLSPVRPSAAVRPGPEDRADAAALLGDGAHAGRFEGPGSLVFRAWEPAGGGRPLSKDPPTYFVFVSARPGGGPDGGAELERTWFAYFGPQGEHPRGLALLMPGLFGTPEPTLELFTRKLRASGWGVVRMMSQPSRFTERVTFEMDLKRARESMEPIARELDQRVAECALAAQAAMRHIAAGHPELAGLPRIAVGMSGGAMTLPTVLAREPEKYAAAVMIAGGCDFYTMTQESNYKYLISAVDYRWEPAPPDDDQRQRLSDLYLSLSRLDSYHAAPLLTGKPMLMIHGKYDGAVPARLGDMLWERLGRPERWVKEAGHEEVFMKLPAEVDRIMQWLGERAGARPQPAGAAEPGEPGQRPPGRSEPAGS